VLKSQVKMVEQIKENMKIIEVGGICLEEKKREEEKKRGQSSTAMSAAAALLSSLALLLLKEMSLQLCTCRRKPRKRPLGSVAVMENKANICSYSTKRFHPAILCDLGIAPM